MRGNPVIAFGQQPCGFLPRRFLWAKIITARRIQAETGGDIVFFYHDSDHDPRETQTIVRGIGTDNCEQLNFKFCNKVQKKYAPLYAKKVLPDWQEATARQLPKYVPPEVVEVFKAIRSENVADFCLQMYQGMGLLEGIKVVRSSDREFRCRAMQVKDYFVDVEYEGETVRARVDVCGGLRLHCGGSAYIELGECAYGAEQISPTRDTRLRWMQSVIQCTHYVAGAGEMQYLNREETPEVIFVERDYIERANEAFTGDES